MNSNANDLENILFGYFDKIKILLSPEIWQNILLNISKNEMLVLLLLYRESDVNMSQIADYLSVPLNTATGIVDRMEKKNIVLRIRSVEDKRVVKIELSKFGREQLINILKMFMQYAKEVIDSLDTEEIILLNKLIEKVVAILKQTNKQNENKENRVRKIIIE